MRAGLAFIATLLAVVSGAGMAVADAPPADPVFSIGEHFAEQTGQALYAASCQDCHMADGQGATGAGRYPALARNPRLEVAGYPIAMIVQGHNAMPAIGRMMSDDQVARVVNYVRTHFGNAWPDAVTVQDVAAARTP